jgi:hypothetical protein
LIRLSERIHDDDTATILRLMTVSGLTMIKTSRQFF